MTYKGETVTEISDELWTLLSMHYLTVKAEIEHRKLPPLERNYIKMLKETYNLQLTEEELFEVKDYAENYYSDAVISRMNHDMRNGMTRL